MGTSGSIPSCRRISGPWTQGAVSPLPVAHDWLSTESPARRPARHWATEARAVPGRNAPCERASVGWDGRRAPFLLHERGFEPAASTAASGPTPQNAVRRYQGAAGVGVVGVAGPSTLHALAGRPAGHLRSTLVRSASTGRPRGDLRRLRFIPGDVAHRARLPRAPGNADSTRAGWRVRDFAGYNTGATQPWVIQPPLGFESWYGAPVSDRHVLRISLVGGIPIGSVALRDIPRPAPPLRLRHFGTPIDRPPTARYRATGKAHASWRRRKCALTPMRAAVGLTRLTAALDRCPYRLSKLDLHVRSAFRAPPGRALRLSLARQALRGDEDVNKPCARSGSRWLEAASNFRSVRTSPPHSRSGWPGERSRRSSPGSDRDQGRHERAPPR